MSTVMFGSLPGTACVALAVMVFQLQLHPLAPLVHTHCSAIACFDTEITPPAYAELIMAVPESSKPLKFTSLIQLGPFGAELFGVDCIGHGCQYAGLQPSFHVLIS